MKKLKILALYILFVMFYACGGSDSGSNPPIATKGDISGQVSLYDQKTNSLDNSGMKITVEGTNPIISAITDAEGKFTLKNVPFYEHDISYEKTGYGTYQLINFKNNVDPTFITSTPSLGQKSDTKVTEVEAEISGTNLLIAVETEPEGSNNSEVYLRFFYSKNSNVSHENYEHVDVSPFIAKINPYKHTLTLQDITNMGFTSEETVYIKVYGESFWANDYEDPSSSFRVFPNLNLTSVDAVSFEVP